MAQKTPAMIQLMEAFDRNEPCPLCYLWLKDEIESMRHVEDSEVSMDKEFRGEIASAAGFCNRHMHTLYRVVFSGQILDGLGYAQYAEDTVRSFREDIYMMQSAFQKEKSRKNKWKGLAKEKSPKEIIDLVAKELELR